MRQTALAPAEQLAEILASVDAARLNERAAARAAQLRGGDVVLFGCGNLGRKSLGVLRAAGIEPAAFADNNRANWNTTVEGLPVLAPEVAATRYGGQAVFAVTILNPGHAFAATRRQLHQLGCERVLSFEELSRAFPARLLPHFALDAASKALADRQAIERGFALLSDEVSRREYVSQVSARLDAALDDFAAADPGEQYFPVDLFARLSCETFVDCGAYDGDTLAAFLRHFGTGFARYFAFEPDVHNFSQLAGAVAALPPQVQSRIHLSRVATGAENGLASFVADGTSSAALRSDGPGTVHVIRLDDYLGVDGPAPTWIKMDIEGAEEEALRGAAGLIRRHQPLLAVCVYHCQDHLWRLPLLIDDIRPGYSFHLRRYAQDYFELVLYAIPPGRLFTGSDGR